jgi:hypothetical protein
MYAAQDMQEVNPGPLHLPLAAELDPYDAHGEMKGTFHPKQAPEVVSYVSREPQGVMYDEGTLHVQVAGKPPQTVTLNLNMAYSFLCAHSNFYNYPLVLTNYVDVPLEYGEKYPPLG